MRTREADAPVVDPTLPPPDWGAPPLRPAEAVSRNALITAAGLAWLVAGAVLYGTGNRVAAPVAGLLVLLGAYAWIRAQPGRALRAAAARPLGPQEQPRVRNVVLGLASDLGMEAPEMWAVPGPAVNALICRRGRPIIAVSEGAAERCTLTEIEAIAAHCLIRLRAGWADSALAAAALGPLGRGARPPSEADVHAAAITRYPPALAAAIEKSEPRGGRFGSLWFVTERDPVTPSDRAALLLDL